MLFRFRIKIHKIINENQPNIISLQFEHPTLAGTQEGGWMAKIKGVYIYINMFIY